MATEEMIGERIRLRVSDDGVADVRLYRADKMNALDVAMFQALIDTGEKLCAMPNVRAVVISGEGRAFCAGLDTSRFGQMADSPKSSGPVAGSMSKDITVRTHGWSNAAQHACMVWTQVPVPVIAAVHGVCFGGGLQIASGADIRVVAPDARLAVMEMKWGIIPDMGGYLLWRGLVRGDVLRELTFTAREFSGEEAARLGFATLVDSDPLARAMAIAEDIATRNPHAIRAAKALFNRHHDMAPDDILMEESVIQQRLIASRNQMEAVMSQMQKRPPDYVDP